jgi:hypothetical protein
MRPFHLVGTALLVAILSTPVGAQPAPKFEYGKAEDVKDVEGTEWDLTAEAGLVYTTGNSRVTTVTGGIKATRKQARNKFSLDASGAFARASTLIARDLDNNMVLTSDEVIREDKESARNYAAKVRFDRFLSERNSLFVAALIGADPLAGKDLTAGGQLGYARLLHKDDHHELSGEFGYDFSHEEFSAATGTSSLSIHSLRAFSGYKGKLAEGTSVEGSLEVLANHNGQTLNTPEVSAMEDLRAHLARAQSAKLTPKVAQ